MTEPRLWLFSRRSDFWFACSGASVGLLAAILVISWHGDRELDAMDFVLSEFHLGATYAVIAQRRLWRSRSRDVLLAPAFILAVTYALSISGQATLLTSITMYAAVWHRGRQSLGVARFYQCGIGGPISRVHERLFGAAIYLPMLASMLAFTLLTPAEYEGEPYFALTIGPEATWIAGLAAAISVIAYLGWALLSSRTGSAPETVPGKSVGSGFVAGKIHPGEWWVVLAHAVAFGSAYVFGAVNASFLLVLAVHHEVQYLYFTYALGRRRLTGYRDFDREAEDSERSIQGIGSELKFARSYFLWPVLGLTGAMIGGWLSLSWIAPLGVGGLFCHYWLDGRIWKRSS